MLLVELSDGKIVTVNPITQEVHGKMVFLNLITDTSTAINGTHGDWDISDITIPTTGADGTAYSNGSVFRHKYVPCTLRLVNSRRNKWIL